MSPTSYRTAPPRADASDFTTVGIGRVAPVLLALIILWLVVVVATSVWVGLRGRRLAVSAKGAQAEGDRYMEAAQRGLVPAKLEELQLRQHVLKEALARLQVSIAEFMVLYRSLDAVRRQLMSARSFFPTK